MLRTENKQIMKIEETVVAWDEMLSFEMDICCLEQLRNNNQDGEQKAFCLNAIAWIINQVCKIILPIYGMLRMVRIGQVIVEGSGRNGRIIL